MLRLLATALVLSLPLGGGAPADPAALLDAARDHANAGRYEAALESSRQALDAFERSADRHGAARAHFRLGAAHDEMAHYDESHRHYDLALTLFRKLDDRFGEATTLSALGTSYRFLGDPRRALELHREALGLFERSGQARAVAWELRHVGIALDDLGRVDEAGDKYRQALEMLPEGDDWAQASFEFQLGRNLSRTSRQAESRGVLTNGLRRARSSGNRWAEARILVELARSAPPGGERLALERATAAEQMLREMGARDLEWEAHFVRGVLLDRAGDTVAARNALQETLSQLEQVRGAIGLPLMRSRYTPKSRPVYEALIRLESTEGSEHGPRLAFEIAERHRARTFADLLLAARAVPRGDESDLTARERSSRATMEALRTRLIELESSPTTRAALERALIEEERRHQAIQLQLERERPIPAGVTDTRPADELVAAIGTRGHVVAYHLSDQGSLAWHVLDGRLRQFTLAPRRTIENLVLVFRSLIVHGNDPPALEAVSRKLYQHLIEPLDLDDSRPLIVVPDGALAYLPFDALGGERGLVIERRAVYYAPSTHVLMALRERGDATPRGRTRLVAIGGPDLAETGGRPALERSASEVRRVAAGIDGVKDVRTGAAATRAAFRELVAPPATAIHVATHGILDSAHPQRSGLVFSDGLFSLYEVLDLRVSTPLVVLSACDTARGELLRGEGILGLSRGFLLAGSQAVVSSLWRVEDRSTEELMVGFYHHLARGLDVAEALRQAKLDWLAAAPAGPARPQDWAAFVAIGDGEVVLNMRPARTRRGAGPWLIALGALLLGAAIIRSVAGPKSG